MAYRFSGGSAQYITASSAAVSTEPMTLFCRDTPNSTPAGVNLKLAICASGSQTNAWLTYSTGAYPSGYYPAAWQGGGGANSQSLSAVNDVIGTWKASTGVFASATSRQYFSDTVAATASTASITTTGVDRTMISAYISGGAVTGTPRFDICDSYTP